MSEDLFFLGIKAVLRNQQGKILLLKADTSKFIEKNYPVHWDLPGGRI